MKTKEEMLKMLYCNLAEIQSGTLEVGSELETIVKTELRLLYNILGEEVKDEYWEQIEDVMY